MRSLSDACSDEHRDAAPCHDSHGRSQHRAPGDTRAKGSRDGQPRDSDHKDQHEPRGRRHSDHADERDQAADQETRCRRYRCLNRSGSGVMRLAPFISHVGRKGVKCVEGRRYLLGKCPGQPALLVDVCEFGELADRVTLLLPRLGIDVSAFDVHLRTDRDILAGGHCHRARSDPGDTCGENGARLCVTRGHPDHEAGGGYQPVVGSQHRRAKPSRASRRRRALGWARPDT
jgi:hypothetical protein